MPKCYKPVFAQTLAGIAIDITTPSKGAVQIETIPALALEKSLNIFLGGRKGNIPAHRNACKSPCAELPSTACSAQVLVSSMWAINASEQAVKNNLGLIQFGLNLLCAKEPPW